MPDLKTLYERTHDANWRPSPDPSYELNYLRRTLSNLAVNIGEDHPDLAQLVLKALIGARNVATCHARDSARAAATALREYAEGMV